MKRIVVAVAVALGGLVGAQTGPTFVSMGQFTVAAVSADGSTAVGTTSTGVPVVWTASGGLKPLPLSPGNTSGQACAVSGNGSVIVGLDGDSNANSGCSWTNGVLKDLVPSSRYGSLLPITGVSNDGKTYTYADSYNSNCYFVSPTTTKSFHMYNVSDPFISGDGRVVAGSWSSDPWAFSWIPPSYVQSLGGGHNTPLWVDCITLHGDHIYGVKDYGGTEVYLVDYATSPYTKLVKVKTHFKSCVAQDNSVVGVEKNVYIPSSGVYESLTQFLQDNGITSTSTGLSGLSVSGISGDGLVLVGTGLDSNSVTQSWMATFALTGKSDHYDVVPNQALNVPAPGVKANDSRTSVNAVLVQGGAHGSVQLNTDGSFTYTPNAGYLGVDSFKYKLVSGLIQSAPVSVGLHIGAISSLKLASSSVIAGNPTTGTVTLNFTVSSPTAVALKSSRTTYATVPASVTIPAGKNSAPFSIGTIANADSQSVSISATYNVESSTQPLLVIGASPVLVSLASTTVGGTLLKGSVTLGLASPSPSTSVAMTSSNSGLATPTSSTLTVAAGQKTAAFSLQTQPTTTNVVVQITATARGASASASVTVRAPTFTSLSVSPSALVAGHNFTVTAWFNGPLPAGVNISVQTLGKYYDILVSAGNRSGSVGVKTSGSDPEGQNGIQAYWNGFSNNLSVNRSTQVTLNPATITGVTGLDSVKGGTALNLTLTYDGDPNSVDQVSFSSSDAHLTAPSPQLHATSVVAQTSSVTTNTPVTFKATYRGVTVSKTITLNP